MTCSLNEVDPRPFQTIIRINLDEKRYRRRITNHRGLQAGSLLCLGRSTEPPCDDMKPCTSM